MSEQKGQTSEQKGPMSEQKGAMSEQKGAMSEQKGSMSEQKARMSEQKGSMSNLFLTKWQGNDKMSLQDSEIVAKNTQEEGRKQGQRSGVFILSV